MYVIYMTRQVYYIYAAYPRWMDGWMGLTNWLPTKKHECKILIFLITVFLLVRYLCFRSFVYFFNFEPGPMQSQIIYDIYDMSFFKSSLYDRGKFFWIWVGLGDLWVFKGFFSGSLPLVFFFFCKVVYFPCSYSWSWKKG